MKYIGYYRRSKKNYDSTLGLESQQAAVQQYVAKKKGELIKEYTEIESGTARSREKRTIIKEAIQQCMDTGAVLVIAKLDRLARDVSFTADLMKSRVKFIALDIPDANHLTIHIMAAIAEHEAKRISQRITEALAVKKQRGEPLGIHTHKDPELTLSKGFGSVALKRAREIRVQSSKDNLNNKRAIGYAKSLFEQGNSLNAISATMAESGYVSPNGKKLRPSTVYRWVNK